MTAFTLHPCHLFPPPILASSSLHSPILFYITPKGRSPRLFPLQASALVYSFCTTSWLLLLLLALLLLFLLLRLPLSSLRSLLLCFCLCSSGYVRYLLASRCVSPFTPSPSCLPFVLLFETGPDAPFVFVEWTRRQQRRKMRAKEIENTGEGKREKLRIERERVRLTKKDCKREEEEKHNLSEACLDTRDAGSNSTVGSGFTKFAISWIVLVLKSFPSRHSSSTPFLLRLIPI